MTPFDKIKPMQKFEAAETICLKLHKEYKIVTQTCCSGRLNTLVNMVEDDGKLGFVNPKVKYKVIK